MTESRADAFAQAEDFAVGVKLTRISFTPLMKLEGGGEASRPANTPRRLKEDTART